MKILFAFKKYPKCLCWYEINCNDSNVYNMIVELQKNKRVCQNTIKVVCNYENV